MRELPNLLGDIDIVIEARDARVPLSGVNRALEGMVRSSWGMPAAATVTSSFSETGRAGPSSWAGALIGEERIGKGKGRMYPGAAADGIGYDSGRGGEGAAKTSASGYGMSYPTGTGLEGMYDRKGKIRERVVVYTKRDLAEKKFEEVSREAS